MKFKLLSLIFILVLFLFGIATAKLTKLTNNSFNSYLQSSGTHSVCMYNGNVYAVYCGGDTSQIYYTVNTTNYKIPDNPLNTTQKLYNNYFPAVANQGEALHIVWERKMPSGKRQIMHAVASSGDSQVDTCAAGSADYRFPSVDLDGSGRVHVAYIADSSIVYYATKDTSKKWVSTVVSATDNKLRRYSAIAVDAWNYVHIAWEEDGEIFYSNNTPGDGKWLTPVMVSTPASGVTNTLPSIDTDDMVALGHAHIAWERNALGTHSIVYANNNSPNPWGEVTLTGTDNNYRPSLRVDKDNQVHIVWEGGKGVSSFQVYYATKRALGWPSGAQLVVGLPNASHPNIVMDDFSNNWYVVFQSTGEGTTYQIYSMDNPPPEIVSEFTAYQDETYPNRVNLSWVNPGDYDLSGVVIRRNPESVGYPGSPTEGTLVLDTTGIAQGKSMTFTDTSLPNPGNQDVAYLYSIFTYDLQKVYSPFDGSATVRVQLDEDRTPPTFSNIRVSYGDTSFYVRCVITDASGIYDDNTGSLGQGVYIEWDTDGELDMDSNETQMNRVATTDTFQTIVQLPRQPDGTTLTVRVYAHDNDFDLGNLNDRMLGSSDVTNLSVSSPPLLYVGVFQNMLLGRYLDIYVVSVEGLSANPTGSVTVGGSSGSISFSKVGTSTRIYNADYQIPTTITSVPDTMTITVSGTDSISLKGTRTRKFSIRFLKYTDGGSIASLDGKAQMIIPAYSMSEDNYVLVSDVETNSTTLSFTDIVPLPNDDNIAISSAYRFGITDSKLNKTASLTISYDDAVIGNQLSIINEKDLAIYSFENGRWVKLNSTVNSTNHTVSANVSKFGTYQIQVSTKSIERKINVPSPTDFALYQNRPNPFNPETIISYQLPIVSNVNLGIYSITGQLIKTLVNETKEAGYYNVRWNGKDETGQNVPSGIYIYRLEVRNNGVLKFSASNTMILLK